MLFLGLHLYTNVALFAVAEVYSSFRQFFCFFLFHKSDKLRLLRLEQSPEIVLAIVKTISCLPVHDNMWLCLTSDLSTWKVWVQVWFINGLVILNARRLDSNA